MRSRGASLHVDPARVAGIPRAARRLAALVSLVSIAGCATAPESAPRIAEVAWEGVEQLERADLERVTELRGPSWIPWRRGAMLDPEVLADDADRLRELYRRRGFYAASIESTVEPLGEPPATERALVRVTYRVEEGPRARVRSFELGPIGGRPLPDALFVPSEVLEVGAPLELASYRAAKQQLVSELGSRGYLAAELQAGADIDVDRVHADLEWWVDPGPRILAGATRITGLETVAPELVLVERQWVEGTVLTTDQIAETQRRLIESGLFRSVVVEAKPTEPTDPAEANDVPAEANDVASPVEDSAVWPIDVRVTERRPRTVEVSLGFGTDDRARGRVKWQHRNLRGNGTRLEASVRHSSLVSELATRLTFPSGGSRVHRELRASILREREVAFDATRTQLGAAIDWKLASGFTARAVYDVDAIRTSGIADATEAALGGTAQSSLITTLGFALDRTTAIPLENPLRGSRLQMRSEVSTRLLGSEVDFALLEADLRRYWPIGETVLATRFRAGVIQPFGAFEPDEVPLPRRFYAGGGDSVRGFEFHRLGPLDAGDNPLGGLSVMTASAELRVPLWERFGGVVFLDTGVLETRPLHFPTRELRHAVGVGLRVDTPVGPLRADVGHLLNPPRDFQRFRLHLSIGQAF